ncbi:MAG: prolipoprotein diacylglyceryltransferase [Flammeovirgaceae bacterium]|jgi:phosphatidylglycerol:prolipoprotein diacylglycerol transferase
MTFSAIIWNAAPDIFKTGVFEVFGFELGPLEVRWYGLLFAMGFLIGQYILIKIFKQEGKPESNVEDLTLYVVLATVIGARLGHCLFYQPDYYLSNPIEILKIWEGGLASHGASIGILFALWLYSRKHKDQSYMWILDRIIIVVALGSAFVRFGNFMNSEIVGKPADTFASVVFARDGGKYLSNEIDKAFSMKIVDDIEARGIAGEDTIIGGVVHQPMEYRFELAQAADAKVVRGVANKYIDNYFGQSSRLQEHVYINPNTAQPYQLATGNISKFTVKAWGKPRHPSQLYESISCFILFFLLLAIYFRYKKELPSGLNFGIFMVWVWVLRFSYEFFKENQVAFEDDLSLNMGQWLSIPLIIAGFIVLFNALKNKKALKK